MEGKYPINQYFSVDNAGLLLKRDGAKRNNVLAIENLMLKRMTTHIKIFGDSNYPGPLKKRKQELFFPLHVCQFKSVPVT
mmetsp:Transcript_10154/g.24431  ORF Transcript_10154/g.24431 Transcript_10154/m.24431 type:complete len:80 (+) Transcript_10154:2303-2542(+)